MKGLLRALLVLTLLAGAADAYAQSPLLWHGARYGMSPAQVKAVVPQAVPAAKPSRLADGSVRLLQLEDIQIVQNTFVAYFYFTGGKLTQVTLSVEKPNFNELMLVFDALTEALRAKYGMEINREVQRGVLNRADATWMNGRTNIDVFAMSVQDHEAQLNINYQVRVAHDADKL